MADPDRAIDRLRLFGVALGVGLLGLLVGGALTTAALLALDAAGVAMDPLVLIVVSLVLTQGVAFGGVGLLYLRRRDLSDRFLRARIPKLEGWIWVGAGYVLALLAAVVAAFTAVAAGAPTAQNQAAELAIEEPDVLLVMIPASFLLIGPGEELLFRGVVQGTIREAFGPIAAIVLASAIFAGVHVVAFTGSPTARLVGTLVLFFPSLVLGLAYERTGNIVVPSLIHGAYNATLFTILYVSLRFAATP